MFTAADILPEQTLPSTLPTPPPKPLFEFVCLDPLCQRRFMRQCGLSRHYNLTGHRAAAPTDSAVHSPPRQVRSRTPRTNTKKRDTLDKLDEYRRDLTIDYPLQHLACTTGISESLLSKWDNHERVAIYDAAASAGGAGSHSTKLGISNGYFPIAEELLYARFLYTRQIDQLPVGHAWLQEKMRDIVGRLNPDGRSQAEVAAFNASNGWSSGFSKRWNISSQCPTNNHTTPIAERVPAIQKFHQFLIYNMQGRLPVRHPVYGHFAPDQIFHLDQVPLPFAAATQRTLNAKGQQCTIKQPGGSGATKRFCTLQVCICARADRQIVRIEIYFRGKGHVSKAEKDYYASLDNVIVRFNEKAWSDESTAMETLEDFRKQTLHLGEVLLGMDGHKAQITPFCRAFMDHMGIRYAITTPNCTDLISPVDRHVGATIKSKIYAKYVEAHKTNKHLWTRPEAKGGLSASRKRILVATRTWTSEAWKEVCRDNQYCIERAFVETGFLLASNGSDRHEIRPYKDQSAKKRGRKRAAGEHSFTNMSPEGLPYDFGPPSKMVKL
jgi:hypothetical protein